MFPLSVSARWVVEAEPGGRVEWSRDSVADIHAKGGLTLWYDQEMRGDVEIEYDACIMGDDRVSDLNCFWMATMPDGKSPITKQRIKERGGKFLSTYTMQLYYVGYGGNHNSTTRFRRYDGDKRGVEFADYRPRILREYLDSAHLLRADHWYHVKLEQKKGRVRYYIDGECLVDYADPMPLSHGYFGFRTTAAHAKIRNFVYKNKEYENRIHVLSIGKEAGMRSVGTTFGVPFLPGEMHEDMTLNATTNKGLNIESDQWTLATWPDGSVKWKAVSMVVPASAEEVILEKANIIRRNNNKGRSSSLPSSISVLPWLEQNGEVLPIKNMVHEQSGDVRDCWRMEGDNFCLRAYTYKGSDEIKLVCTTFIDSLTAANGLKSLALRVKVPMKNAVYQRRVLFADGEGGVMKYDVKPLVSRRRLSFNEDGSAADSLTARLLPQLAAWDGFRLSQLSPGAFSVRKRATTLSPWIGTKEGGRAPGLVAVGDSQSSFAVHLTDFWQSYPSTLQVDGARGDTAIVSLFMWSEEAEAMNFAHYDTIPHGLDAAYEDVQPGMSTAVGTARTTVMYLYPMAIGIDSVASILPSLAVHPQYLPTPQYLHEKRAFGLWSLDRGTSLDSTIYDIIKFYDKEQERHSWYGYFNYGDVMHTYDAWRDEWRYDVGGYAWDNTELGTPAMLWYEFLRTGSPLAWRMAFSMSRHNAEVDCYHRGPHAGLGTRHNVLHWGCGAKEARISQAFWLRFPYYLTADERMGDIIHEVTDADTLLYHLDPMRLAQPRSERYPCTAPARLRIGPDWLAYAGNWFTEWERTGNTYYRDKILTGMKSISALPHGIFSGPKALGYDPATGIISWEGDSSVMNTNHLLSIMGGFEMMNEIMLSLTTPQWHNTWLEHAEHYKENALKISKNKFLIPRLKAYAYWQTGKQEYWQTALDDLNRGNPFRTLTEKKEYGAFYTNDAATFILDAIFMQAVMRDER